MHNGQYSQHELFDLLRAVCHTAIDASVSLPEELPHLPETGWQQLLQTSQQHRVTPLLRKALQANQCAFPQAFGNELEQLCRRNTARCIFLSEQLKRISKLLSDAGISYVPLKGTVLSQMLHGDPCIRQVDDIDLLISPADVPRAEQLLQAAGFSPVHAPLSRDFLLQRGWDWPMQDQSKQFHVDISATLGAHYLRLPLTLNEHLIAARKTQTEGDMLLPALPPLENCLLLAIHGWKHGWARLSWVVDFAQAARAIDSEKEELFKLAGRFNCIEIIKQAYGVAEAWMPGESDPRDLASRVNQKIAVSGRWQLIRDSVNILPNPGIGLLAAGRERRIDRIMMRVTMITAPGFSDWRALPLPRKLWWLYYLTRPFRLSIGSIAKRGLCGSAQPRPPSDQ